MKKLTKLALVALLCAFLMPTKGFSQERTNVVKTNPLAMAFGNFNGTYEKVLNSKSSILVSASYVFKMIGIDIKGGGLGLGYRYYFTHAKKEIPSGFWVMPEASFAFGKINEPKAAVKGNFRGFAIGAQIGYQWAWNSGFTLDLGAGPSYAFVSGETKKNVDIPSKINPVLTMAIGYAF